MHIPLAKYGMREMIVSALLCLVLGVALGWIMPWLALIPAIFYLWVLSFFRNPARTAPGGPDTVVSPADGKITFVGEVDEPEFIGGRALKISIFLSVFNAHLNRAPLSGRVAFLKYTEGKFINAMNEKSSQVNENNLIGVVCDEGPGMKMLIKQVSGAIARRIVCDVTMDQPLERGQILGMIKFGSRTDLFLPLDGGKTFTPSVNVGQAVKAGLSVLGVLQ